MKNENIISLEPILFYNFLDGHPIEVRTQAQHCAYKKGGKIHVRFEDDVLQKAVIVSEPMEVIHPSSDARSVAFMLEKDLIR